MTDALFPIVDQLLAAGSHQERAAQLLRLSDGLVHSHGVDIVEGCRAANFEAGAVFVLARLTALLRVRDAHGLLPDCTARNLEDWRKAMSQFAADGSGWVAAGVLTVPEDLSDGR